jgi:hypothetical protein
MHQRPTPLQTRHLTTMRKPVHPSSPLLPIASALHHSSSRSSVPHFGFVVAVIAPGNNAGHLEDTLVALDNQTRPPDAVIAVVDSAADAVAITALANGATVVETNVRGIGRFGALSLALDELLEVLDDSDLLLLVGNDVAPEPLFIAAAVRHLWPTSPALRTASPEAVRLADAVIGNEIQPPTRVRSEKALRQSRLCESASLTTVAALRHVADCRRDGSLPDRAGSGGVFDLGAVDPPTELTVALLHSGARVNHESACRYRRIGPPSPPLSATIEEATRHHHGRLDAVNSHGVSSNTVRSHVSVWSSNARLTIVPLLVATVLVALWRDDELPMAVPVAGFTVAIWSGTQAWAARHSGWRQTAWAATLIPWGLEAVATGWGRVRGVVRWAVQRHAATRASRSSHQREQSIEVVRVDGARMGLTRTAQRSSRFGSLPGLARAAALLGLPLLAITLLAVTATTAAWTIALMALIGSTVFWATRNDDATQLIGVVRTHRSTRRSA